MDPGGKSTAQDLEKQFALELRLSRALEQPNQAAREVREARTLGQITAETEKQLAGGGGRRGEEEEGTPGGPAHVTLAELSGTLAQLLSVTDSADAAPTTQVATAAEQTLRQLDGGLQRRQSMKKEADYFIAKPTARA